MLSVNVGAKTKDAYNVPGAWEYGLCTRPIPELFTRIKVREKEFLKNG